MLLSKDFRKFHNRLGFTWTIWLYSHLKILNVWVAPHSCDDKTSSDTLLLIQWSLCFTGLNDIGLIFTLQHYIIFPRLVLPLFNILCNIVSISVVDNVYGCLCKHSEDFFILIQNITGCNNLLALHSSQIKPKFPVERKAKVPLIHNNTFVLVTTQPTDYSKIWQYICLET